MKSKSLIRIAKTIDSYKGIRIKFDKLCKKRHMYMSLFFILKLNFTRYNEY